jgi:ABC-type transport system involved in multi-copper enzyme maturation permease subunit
VTRFGPILVIARLTLAEAVRRRLLWVLVALTVLIVALTAWAFGRINEVSPVTGSIEMAAVSQVLVMLAFMFSFVLAMTAVFAAAPAIGPEIESGLLLAVLARPVRRSDVLLGRWLGLAVIVAAYAVVAGYLELGAVALTTRYWPADPWLAPWYLAWEALVLLTLALAMSTRVASVAGGAVAVVGYGLAWMAGIMGGIGTTLNNDVLRGAGSLARLILPSDVLWRGAMFSLEPPPGVLDAGGLTAQAFRVSPFFAGSGPEPIWLAWCLVWVTGTLALGIALFNRREV